MRNYLVFKLNTCDEYYKTYAKANHKKYLMYILSFVLILLFGEELIGSRKFKVSKILNHPRPRNFTQIKPSNFTQIKPSYLAFNFTQIKPLINFAENSIIYKYSNKALFIEIKKMPQVEKDIQNLIHLSERKNKEWPVRKFPQPITAVSKNHLGELLTHIGKLVNFITSFEFSTYFDQPEEIIIYNIDRDGNFKIEIEKKVSDTLKKNSIAVKSQKVKITVKNFKFENYPEHVKVLRNYAWKVIINSLSIVEYGNIWWFDSSIQPKKDKYEIAAKVFADYVYSKSKENCYLFTAPSAQHGLSWGTCNKMLNYIPTVNKNIWYRTPYNIPGIKFKPMSIVENVDSGSTMEQAGNAFQLGYTNNENCVLRIFLPLYMCVLYKDCISPKGSAFLCYYKRGIKVKEDKSKNNNICPKDKNYDFCKCNGTCHRFDQSLTNLIVGNYYNYNKRKYTFRGLLIEANELSKEILQSYRHSSDVVVVHRG